MIETSLTFPLDIGDVLDVDFCADASLISLQGYGARQVVVLPHDVIELPRQWASPRFTHLRAFVPGQFILIDASSELVARDNAFIFSENGALLTRFHVGAGVIDATPTGSAIALAYHPEAATEIGLEAGPISQTGVGIFDGAGRLIASLNGDLERDGYHAFNIQCLCARETGELIIVPEVLSGPEEDLDSPIVFYDWRANRWSFARSSLSRPLAISSRGTKLYIYSPEESEDELIECDLRGGRQKSHGFFKNIFRGMRDGRFLAQFSGLRYHFLQIPNASRSRCEPSDTERQIASVILGPGHELRS